MPEIPFPKLGIWKAAAHHQQPELTCAAALNVQGIWPYTLREQGGQRAGIEKWSSARISSTDKPQDLTTITKHDDRLTYTAATSGSDVSADWSAAARSSRPILSMVTDRQANVYAIAVDVALTSGINYLIKYNAVGAIIWTYPLPLAANAEVATSVRLDDDGYIYVCFGNNNPGRVRKYEEVDDSQVLELLWEVELPNGGSAVDVAIRNGSMYVAENTGGARYLHFYEKAYESTPVLVWSANIENSTTYTTSAIGFALDGGCIVSMVRDSANNGRLRKFGPAKPTGGPPVTPVWEYTGSGVGLGLVVSSSGHCYTHGRGATYHFADVIDNGSSATLSREIALAGMSNFVGPNIVALDALGDAYVAYSAATPTGTLYKIASTVADHGAVTWSESTGTAGTAGALAVAAYPFLTDADTKCEFVYSACADTTATLVRHRQVTVTRSEGSPRTVTVLGVAGGNIKKMTTGASTAPTNGTGALSSTARWVCSAVLFNRVLYADGLTYKSYNALTDTVSAWAATSAGSLPERCRLLVIWNGRAVLAGAENDPANWYMSAQGDVDDWNYFPRVRTVTQAVAGNNADAGKCPDVINCLIPYSDDLLLFGGDHSIYRLTGDPAQGGRFDRVTDTTGIAFGQSVWCKDESGTIYFWGSRGNVYRYVPGSGTVPELISEGRFDEFRAIDLSANRVQLVWDTTEQVLRVYVTPYTAGTTTHYTWEPPNVGVPMGRWWDVQFGSTSYNPRAVTVLDGDTAADRLLIMACEDGYVRNYDGTVNDDDGTGIESYVVIGPMQPGGQELESMIRNIRAVMNTSGTVNYTVYSGEDSNFSNASSVFTGTWSNGRNNPVNSRARGQSIWIKVGRYPTPTTGRWGYEAMAADFVPLGVVRNR